jgi:hypothetical protein
MRKILLATLLSLAPCFAFGAAIPILTVSNATINYTANQVTINGTSFEILKKSPTVLFSGAPLTIASFTNTQIVAKLPANTAAGTYVMIVANSLGEFNEVDLTFGANGPQGPIGPSGVNGAQGPAGPVGPAGPKGAAGPAGALGLTGAIGPAGPAGPEGLMGNPGPAGAARPAGPVGPAGGVLSFAKNTVSGAATLPVAQNAMLNSITLSQAGTYVIGGEQVFYNADSYNYAEVVCLLYGPDGQGGTEVLLTVPGLRATVESNENGVIPLNGYYVAQTAPVVLQLECEPLGPSTYFQSYGGSLTAIQVQ